MPRLHEFMIISIAGFNPLVYSGIINTRVYLLTTVGEIFGHYTAFFCVFLSIFIVVIQIYVFSHSLKTLISPEFNSKWGFLYSDFRKSSKLQMMTSVVYTVRRASLILLAFFFKSSPTIQLLLAYLINFLGSIFFMHVSTHQDQLLNKIEVLNEVTVLIVNIHLFCFTELVENAEIRN